MPFAESSWHSSWSLNKLAWWCGILQQLRHTVGMRRHRSAREKSSAQSTRCKRRRVAAQGRCCHADTTLHTWLTCWFGAVIHPVGLRTCGSCTSIAFFSFLLHVSVTNYTDSPLPSLPPLLCFKPNGGWQENTQRRGSLEDCVLGIRCIPQRQVYQWALKSTTNFSQSSQERKQPR